MARHVRVLFARPQYEFFKAIEMDFSALVIADIK
jgi:hypothetical protein